MVRVERFFFVPILVYAGKRPSQMNNIIGNNEELLFANGQSSRDLRASSGNLHERTDSSDPLQALRKDSDEVLESRIELPTGLGECLALRVETVRTLAYPNDCYWAGPRLEFELPSFVGGKPFFVSATDNLKTVAPKSSPVWANLSKGE